MILNETQKQEIADYVGIITRYMETYNELYDHILSALSAEKYESFNMSMVFNIIDEDFGGIKKIKLEEGNSQKALYKSFSASLKREMLNTFKFPAMLTNLAYLGFGYILYHSGEVSGKFSLAFKLISVAIMIIPLLLYWVKTLIIDRRRTKPSISNYALRYTSLLGMNFATSVILVFIAKHPLISLSSNAQFMILFGLYYLLSIYFRAYLKIYFRSIKLQVQ